MVSPHFVKKGEQRYNLNRSAKKLFQLIYIKKNKLNEREDDSSNITVSTMVSKLSFFYEKIRNAVDYDDEHLLRKNAIKRIFKRQLLIEGILKNVKSQELSIHLLTELIQAGYLENDSVPEKKIYEVADILDKYIKLKDFSLKKGASFFSFSKKKDKEKRKRQNQKEISDWIMSLAASEIEVNLMKDEIQEEVVSDMFDILKNNIKLPRDLPHEEDLDIQIYLAIARNYLNFDIDLLNFVLFKYYNKNWGKIDEDGIEALSEKIDVLYLAISRQLDHPLKKQLDKIIKSYSLYFSILKEVIDDNPIKVYDQAVNSYKAFNKIVRDACEKRYKRIKSKLWKSGFRSIIYIFLTKSIFVVLVEVPAIRWFGEELNSIALAINISFPAFLLFIMILFTWSPAKENTKKIVDGVEEIVFSEKRKKRSILLRKPPKRSLAMDIVFNILYLGGLSVTIYATIMGLIFLNFNWLSIIIFLFFLMFASFFSFRIKREMKRFIIIEPKEGFIGFLFDFFYTPVIAMGKVLSNNMSKINVFIFVMDFIIEAPFKVFVEIFDDWIKYLKERKEDLVN
jgi:hypothetical protein